MRFFLFLFLLLVSSIFSFSFILEYSIKQEIEEIESIYNSDFIYEKFHYDIINNNIQLVDIKFNGLEAKKIIIENFFYNKNNKKYKIKDFKFSVYQFLNAINSDNFELFHYLNNLSKDNYFYSDISYLSNDESFIFDMNIKDIFSYGVKILIKNYNQEFYKNIDIKNTKKINDIHKILEEVNKVSISYFNFYFETSGLFKNNNKYILEKINYLHKEDIPELNETINNIFYCLKNNCDIYFDLESNNIKLMDLYLNKENIDLNIYSSIK